MRPAKESPRQAKVRRMMERFVDRFENQPRPVIVKILPDLRDMLAQFGLEVWTAARRQFKREMNPSFHRRQGQLARIRRAGH